MLRARPSGRLRLYCLAYAGGTATTVYAPLKEELAPVAEVIPLDLPGRSAPSTATITTVDDLAEIVLDTILNRNEERWGILGHSFGGSLAFEVACRAESRGHEPSICIVSGCQAPSGRRRFWNVDLSDEELLTQVSEGGRIPQEFLTHSSLRALAAGRLREDLLFSKELQGRDPPPLCRTPLHVFAGADDPVVPPATATLWHQYSRAGVTVEIFDGNHFFLFVNPAARAALASCLRPLATQFSAEGTS